MTHISMLKISKIALLFHCFLWNGGWAQAVDNRPRQQSGFPKGSANDLLSKRWSSVSLPKSNLVGNAPSVAPILAPTAAPSAFVDTSSDQNEHNAWLQQQHYSVEQQYQVQSSDFTSPTSRRNKGVLPSFLSAKSLKEACRSFVTASKTYSQKVHGTSPTTYWTTIVSILVFLSWNLLPMLHPILMQFFLASRKSAQKSLGLSLVLSAVSHNSFRHLLVNLFVFLQLSPALSKKALWPLLVGGAIAGNLLFLLFRPGGSCLGLSGVTCAMMGVYGCMAPERLMKVRIYGVLPLTFKMKTLIQVLMGVSLFGALFMPSSPICHLGHLGGLLFGILYYQKASRPRKRSSYTPTYAPTAAPTNAL